MSFMEILQVHKNYGQKSVLKNVTVEIEKGQFTALLGPSGCGKTTLLNAIAGLVELDAGIISLDGEILSQRGFTKPPEKRNIGFVFQDFALWPHMTVFDNVAFGLRMKKMSKSVIADRIHEVLDIVHMKGYEKMYPHQLSGGQKQRIAIARALAPQPAVLLMDEPLSSLDAKLREEMKWELLNMLQTIGITTIYVTHDQAEAMTMADHLVLLNDGRLEQQGIPSQVYHSPNSVFSATFLGASNVLEGITAKKLFSGIANDGHNEDSAVVIRPQHIRMMRKDERFIGGNCILGKVNQRAFHGSMWQYKINLESTMPVTLEVWAQSSFFVGEEVKLYIEQKYVLPLSPSV